MKEFFKKDFEIFAKEVDAIYDFLFQPVYLFGKPDLALRPTSEEAEEKKDQGGFWKNEWDLFKKEMSSVADFLMQPIEIK